jgi:Ni/Co efflux regulator RcnB
MAGRLAPASEVAGGHTLPFYKGHGLSILKWHGTYVLLRPDAGASWPRSSANYSDSSPKL